MLGRNLATRSSCSRSCATGSGALPCREGLPGTSRLETAIETVVVAIVGSTEGTIDGDIEGAIEGAMVKGTVGPCRMVVEAAVEAVVAMEASGVAVVDPFRTA